MPLRTFPPRFLARILARPQVAPPERKVQGLEYVPVDGHPQLDGTWIKAHLDPVEPKDAPGRAVAGRFVADRRFGTATPVA